MQAQVWELPWFWGSPELTHWKHNPQSNCVKRQGICEVIRHEGLSCHSRTEVPIEGEKDRQTPSLTTESTKWPWPSQLLELWGNKFLLFINSYVFSISSQKQNRLRAGLAKKWPKFKCQLVTCHLLLSQVSFTVLITILVFVSVYFYVVEPITSTYITIIVCKACTDTKNRL